MTDDDSIAIGLDMGTGGARTIAVNLRGDVLAESRRSLPASAIVVDGPRVEQDPCVWATVSEDALRGLMAQLPPAQTVIGISVDATSGTFLLVDQNDRPVTAGIMYNDQRAADVASEVSGALHSALAPYGIQIGSSFALPKIVHVCREDPACFQRARRIVHQTDWIVGMLTGHYDVTDISTALKTGADPGTLDWPAALETLGIPGGMLPRIVRPGEPIGQVTRSAAERTGLPPGTPVVAGCTDGTAGCLASGASQFGDLNVTLGTTLVFKAVAQRPLIDPGGAIYNHRHPAGGYLPGAASSTGAEWIQKYFLGADLDALSRDADRLIPTDLAVYPLVKTGERFPFLAPQAAGFGLDEIREPALRLAAGMEGVAYLERLAIEQFARLGLATGPTIFATGKATTSDLWLKIRASVNRRTYSVPENAESAIGAAILAATPVLGDCRAAIAAIVRPGRVVQPDTALADAYDEGYRRFVRALQKRDYGRGES